MNRNARLGVALFAIYFVVYLGFVLLNTFSPSAMEATPLAGVNLAILYGLGLIFAAFALSILYGAMCGRSEGPSEPASDEDSEKGANR